MRDHRAPRRDPDGAAGLWLYGLHAVRAALENRRRTIRRCLLTERAAELLAAPLGQRVRPELTTADKISRLLPQGAVHQGAALQCQPLPRLDLGELIGLPGRKLIVVLDQIEDPHNVGAILRSAAAFGVAGMVVQDRHAPPESGTLAKAASGALDLVPYLQVVNIARTLEELGEAGFWRVALTGDGEQRLEEAAPEGDGVLVLGSEGSGLRRLVRARCDVAAFVPIGTRMESLNVSNAAAIALYEFQRAAFARMA
ncbi:MAG TPA: 23S rRNA (guanosine(2251)-2'-O)-methyltransferase RlmB [Rhizomicrobium sp.]